MAVRTVAIVMAVWIFAAAGIFAEWFAWAVTAFMAFAFFRWVARQVAADPSRRREARDEGSGDGGVAGPGSDQPRGGKRDDSDGDGRD